MNWDRYEKDRVNNRFYKVEAEKFTDEEWESLCERWVQKKKIKKIEISPSELILIMVIFLSFEAKLLGVW